MFLFGIISLVARFYGAFLLLLLWTVIDKQRDDVRTHLYIHIYIYNRFGYCANWIATISFASYFQINPENEMNFRFAVWCLHRENAIVSTIFVVSLKCFGTRRGDQSNDNDLWARGTFTFLLLLLFHLFSLSTKTTEIASIYNYELVYTLCSFFVFLSVVQKCRFVSRKTQTKGTRNDAHTKPKRIFYIHLFRV